MIDNLLESTFPVWSWKVHMFTVNTVAIFDLFQGMGRNQGQRDTLTKIWFLNLKHSLELSINLW